MVTANSVLCVASKKRCPFYLELDCDNFSSFVKAPLKRHSEVLCVCTELIYGQYLGVLDHQMSASTVF